MTRERQLIAWLPLGSLLLCCPALAQQKNEPTEAEMAEAEQLFVEGQAAYKEEKYAQALVKFLDSYDLFAADELLFNIGFCYEKLDQKNKAIEYYKKYLDTIPEDEEKSRAEVLATIEVLEGKQNEAEPEKKSKVQQFKQKVVKDYRGDWMHGLWAVVAADFMFENKGYYPKSDKAGLGVKAAYNLRLLERKLSLGFEVGYLSVGYYDQHAWSLVFDVSAGYRVGMWKNGSLQLYVGGGLDFKYYKTRLFLKFGSIGVGPFVRLYWHWSEKVGLLVDVMPTLGVNPGGINGYVYGYMVLKLGFFFGLK